MNCYYNIIELAIRKARNSTQTHQHGCVMLDKRGNVVGSGANVWSPFNDRKFSIEQRHLCGAPKSSPLHAEVRAYYSVPPRLRNNLTLVVIRYRNGVLRNSKPCANCQKFIDEKNIRVFYSDDNGKIRRG